MKRKDTTVEIKKQTSIIFWVVYPYSETINFSDVQSNSLRTGFESNMSDRITIRVLVQNINKNYKFSSSPTAEPEIKIWFQSNISVRIKSRL